MNAPISAAALLQTLSGRAVPPWVAGFYTAYLTRDPQLLDAILDDDVDWLLAGPAEQFDFFGHRRGKGEVIELVTRIMPCYFHLTDFEMEHLLANGDRAAMYGRVRARQRDTGRAIRFRGAHFLRFAEGKLISYRGIADTFDAAEQLVGHPIDVTKKMECVVFVPEDDFTAV